MSLVAQTVKNLPAVQETGVQSLGLEDPLEKGMATHSIILAWRIPWTEEPGGYSPWGHKELDTTECLTLSLFHSLLENKLHIFRIHREGSFSCWPFYFSVWLGSLGLQLKVLGLHTDSNSSVP